MGHKTLLILLGHPNVKLFDKTLSFIYNYVTFLYKRMTTSTDSMKRYTTTEYGKQNMFAHEPQVEVIDVNYWENAEQLNGRLAMIGFFAAVHNYILTGYVIPGIW